MFIYLYFVLTQMLMKNTKKKEEMNKMKKNLYIIIIKWKKIKDKI